MDAKRNSDGPDDVSGYMNSTALAYRSPEDADSVPRTERRADTDGVATREGCAGARTAWRIMLRFIMLKTCVKRKESRKFSEAGDSSGVM